MDYMRKPIANVADAETFIRALHADGKLYHFDDDPADVIEGLHGPRTFTPEQAKLVSARVAEMRALPGFDPFDLAVALHNEDLY